MILLIMLYIFLDNRWVGFDSDGNPAAYLLLFFATCELVCELGILAKVFLT